MLNLEARFEISNPLREPLEGATNRIYEELEVLMALEDRTTISTLGEELENREESVLETFDCLEEKGLIERDEAESERAVTNRSRPSDTVQALLTRLHLLP